MALIQRVVQSGGCGGGDCLYYVHRGDHGRVSVHVRVCGHDPRCGEDGPSCHREVDVGVDGVAGGNSGQRHVVEVREDEEAYDLDAFQEEAYLLEACLERSSRRGAWVGQDREEDTLGDFPSAFHVEERIRVEEEQLAYQKEEVDCIGHLEEEENRGAVHHDQVGRDDADQTLMIRRKLDGEESRDREK